MASSWGVLRVARRCWLGLSLAFCLASFADANARDLSGYQKYRKYNFDIEEKNLGAALEAFVALTRVQFIYPYEMAGEEGMNPVVGWYTIDRALTILLKGTGFSGGLTKSGVLVISLDQTKRPDNQENMMSLGGLKKLLLSTMTPLALGLSASGAGYAQLDEIIVTAEKRAESLQDVPISIIVMNEDQLEMSGISELEDFDAHVPNVLVNEYYGIATTFRSFIRGVGVYTVEVTQDPAVALYTDGIYVGSSYGGSFESADLERVEVLRGPQGTLYGRNATGGAINLISRKPTLGEWQFGQTLNYGRFNEFKSATRLNIPLGDKAAARGTLVRSKRDGWVENLGPGKDFGMEDRLTGRLALKFVPISQLEMDLAFDYSEMKDSTRYAQILSGAGATAHQSGTPINSPLGPPGSPTVDTYYPDPVTRDRLSKAASLFPVEQDDNRIFGASFTLAWDLNNNLQLKSITGYRDVESAQFTLVSGTMYSYLNIPAVPVTIGPYPSLVGGNLYLDFKQFTQELQLLGDLEMKGGNLEYIGGLYFYQDEGFSRDTTLSFSGPQILDTTATENRSYALFGQATYVPHDSGFEITLGARYSIDKREALRNNLDVTPVFIDSKYSNDFENFSPSVTVAYNFNQDVNIYGKVVTGYRSGSTSTLSAIESLYAKGADAETIISYEIGLKSQFLDNRLRFNTALFWMDYQDYQVSIQTGLLASERDTVNIGDATIKGLEADLTVSLTDHLNFSASLGLLETEYGQRSFDPGTGAPPSLFVKELPFAVDLSYTLGFAYERELSNGFLFSANINYSYQGESESAPLIEASKPNDAKALLDAGVSLANIPVASGFLKLRLWGKNLTDDEYAVNNYSTIAFLGANEVSPFGDPRTYGFTINYDFN